MTKNELLKYPFEEVLKMSKTTGFVKKLIDNQYIFSIMLKNYCDDKIIEIIQNNHSIINEKNENGTPYSEVLTNLGKSKILEKFGDRINFLQTTSDGNYNILGYLIKKNLHDLVDKGLENNPTIMNEKDPSGCVGTERLIDSNFGAILEKYANHIDLLKKDFNGERNILGYLSKRGMVNVIIKALENKSTSLNEKDPSGCVGTERLADAGLSIILEKYAADIDLLKKDYNGEKNMLGYLAKSSMEKVINKALEKNPTVLNEKDPSGCVGTERLADAGLPTTLEKYADHIDLLKRDFNGQKNMLGYLVSKGFNNVVFKALKHNPKVMNEKDPSGCVGTERLADAGYKNILEEYAEMIDLLKIDYNGERNMLGYLAKREMNHVVLKALHINSNALNTKDSVSCLGVERLIDSGAINIVNEFADRIDWNKKATNDQTIFEYVIKRSNSQAEEIAIKALLKNPEIIPKEIKFIIDHGLTKVITYKEILSKINKNMTIGEMNLLAYLSHKNQEYCVDLLLNQEKASYYKKNTSKEESSIAINSPTKEEMMESIKLTKDLSVENKPKKEYIEKEKPVTIKAKIKAML